MNPTNENKKGETPDSQTLSEFPAAEVLHIGDHDPSGVHVFSSMAEDVQAFAVGLGASTLPVFNPAGCHP